MDYRRGLPSKRVFGKDITNIERRTKNNSISEKNSTSTVTLPEQRHKSRSFAPKILPDIKDPLFEYEP